MHIRRMDPAHLEEAYGILCQGIYPWEGFVEPPFGAGWAVVEPGKRTKHHGHQEGETFLIVKGRVGGEPRGPGPRSSVSAAAASRGPRARGARRRRSRHGRRWSRAR